MKGSGSGQIMTDRCREAQNYTDPDHNTEYTRKYSIYFYDYQPVLTFAFQILVQKENAKLTKQDVGCWYLTRIMPSKNILHSSVRK
jgi:hypothetical protein